MEEIENNMSLFFFGRCENLEFGLMVVKSPVTEYHETEDIFLTHCYISIKIIMSLNQTTASSGTYTLCCMGQCPVGHLEVPGKGSSAHAEQLCMSKEAVVLVHPDCKGLPIQTYSSV